MSPDLSPASRAVLTQLVTNRRVDLVPAELVDLKLVRQEVLKGVNGLLATVWVPTKRGRLAVANFGDGE